MKYRFQHKRNKAVHMLRAADGQKTWCQMENSTSGKYMTEYSEEFPTGRRACMACEQVKTDCEGKAIIPLRNPRNWHNG